MPIPKGCRWGQNVGLAYLVNPIDNQLNILGGVGDYPKLNTVWDMNANGQSAGAASVYLRPPDLNGDGYISTNEVRAWSLEVHDFDINGLLQGVQTDERTISAGYPGNAALQLYYNAFLTSAARFNTDTSWNWLGPVNFTSGSLFSVGLLINDQGDVAGIGATHTGDPTIDSLNPTRVFRWNVGDGEFAKDTPVVQALGLLPSGQHAFPLAMNQTETSRAIRIWTWQIRGHSTRPYGARRPARRWTWALWAGCQATVRPLPSMTISRLSELHRELTAIRRPCCGSSIITPTIPPEPGSGKPTTSTARCQTATGACSTAVGINNKRPDSGLCPKSGG